MATPAVKLLLADVDGTLVTKDKVLTDRAIEAVHKLHDAGVIFAITSGRPRRSCKPCCPRPARRSRVNGARTWSC